MRFFSLFCALLFSFPALAGTVVQNENTRAELLVEQTSASAGGELRVGVRLTPREKWHFYWENPGDAGIPTTLTWSLPEGVKAGDITWPLPKIIREQQLAVYGYDIPTLLTSVITLPKDYSGNSLPLAVKAEWLICHDICIPESAELALDIPVGGDAQPSDDAAVFKEADNAQPEPIETPLPLDIGTESFTITLPDTSAEGQAQFFVREQNLIRYAEPQTRNGQVLSIPRDTSNTQPPAQLSGYIKIGEKAYNIRAKAGAIAAAAEPAVSQGEPAPSGYSFIMLLLFAIIGGLILNLMPCVLPVLSLKAIAIAKKSGHERKIVVRQALAYTAGVVLSFVAIAVLLISLQKAGEQIGWGFQMQSPPFVGFLIVLLFVVGLNLAGMFEVPVLFGNVLSDTRQHGLRGSFLTGVLATAVATPCTAPFMATAVGATLALPPLLSLLVFAALGVGLALPFLLIAVFPRTVSYLPRPGAWMETFKQFMAFPMFASVVWLLWVLTQQTGAQGLLVVLITLLVISFIIWLKGRCQDSSPLCKIAILLLLIGTLVNGMNALHHLQPEASTEQAFSASMLSELREAGTPVFVDATAAWCLTCQVNKRVAIDTPAARAAFAETGTKLLIADWTNRNPEITAFLKDFGYNGVPLYVYFPASGEPVVLPQILSESLVISTIKGDRP